MKLTKRIQNVLFVKNYYNKTKTTLVELELAFLSFIFYMLF
jgi:hypothetical protein